MDKATARPWEIMDDGDRDFTGQYDVWIRAHHGEDGGLVVGAAWREDATLIVKAVNAHDGLVTELTNLLLYHASGGHEGDGSDAAIQRCIAALALTKVEDDE